MSLKQLYNDARQDLSLKAIETLVTRKYTNKTLTNAQIGRILNDNAAYTMQATSLIALCDVLGVSYEDACKALREEMQPND